MNSESVADRVSRSLLLREIPRNPFDQAVIFTGNTIVFAICMPLKLKRKIQDLSPMMTTGPMVS